MAGRRKATTWAEIEQLPEAARESFLLAFRSWTNDRFAPDLAHYWPMTDRRLLGMRSPYGSARRRPGNWPECWFDHGWVRDCLLTAYVWDQEIASGKDATAGADRAAYQEHVRNVLVPEVQQIAQMCSLGHVDPAEQSVAPDPWRPAPPPLPGQEPIVVTRGTNGTSSPPGTSARHETSVAPVGVRQPLVEPGTSARLPTDHGTRELIG